MAPAQSSRNDERAGEFQRALDVVTFGEVMVLLCAEPGRPLRSARKFDRSLAGAEANVAIGLARLGHTAGWFGRVGDDSLGRGVLDTLRGEGVDLRFATIDSERPTGLLVRDVHVNRRIEVVYQRHGSAGQRLTADDVDSTYVSSSRLLLVTGITPALGPEAADAVLRAVDIARASRVVVAFDPNIRLRLWESTEVARLALRSLASKAQIVLSGLGEAEFVSGEKGASAAAGWFLDHGADVVAVKLGAEGAWATDGRKVIAAPGRPVQVVDPIGAGDAFNAGFLSGWLHGLDLEGCLTKANLVAAASITALGDFEGLPTEGELESFRSRNYEAER